MYAVPAVGGPVQLTGHLDLVRTAVGWQPWRLPQTAQAQFPPDAGHLRTVTRQPSGVRLRLTTRATRIELDVLVTRLQIEDAPALFPPGRFDLVIDGDCIASEPATGGSTDLWNPMTDAVRFIPGEPGTVAFADLPAGEKAVEIWLPQAEAVELIEVRADAPIHPPTVTGRPVWVHHGSSISHCAEADSPTGTWPAVAARVAGLDLVNVGLGGNAMLDPFTARALSAHPADVITVKLGINIVNGDAMRLRTFVPAVHGFLDLIREGHPHTPLLVISPILCPTAEHTPGPTQPDLGDGGVVFRAAGDPADIPAGRLTLTVIRAQLQRIVAERQTTDPALHYLDGRELYGEDDTVDHPLPDGLHPDAATYRLMGERFAGRVFAATGVIPVRTVETSA